MFPRFGRGVMTVRSVVCFVKSVISLAMTVVFGYSIRVQRNDRLSTPRRSRLRCCCRIFSNTSSQQCDVSNRSRTSRGSVTAAYRCQINRSEKPTWPPPLPKCVLSSTPSRPYTMSGQQPFRNDCSVVLYCNTRLMHMIWMVLIRKPTFTTWLEYRRR